MDSKQQDTTVVVGGTFSYYLAINSGKYSTHIMQIIQTQSRTVQRL